ncbi:MAG: hypothetical protein L6Q98_24260 [Anaerolineae bacterium]|nr:hypothetical protein [Anaerolineae bacterium]NUQ06616.1 hypothetical protein [Anaerolineae bacterium]
MSHLSVTDLRITLSRRLTIGFSLLLIAALAACGGAPAETPGAGAATRPPAGGAPATIGIPTYVFVEPTVTLPVTAAPETTAEAALSEATTEAVVAALDPQAVERGRGRYEAEALECGECHGVNGEGTEEGSSLLEFTMSEDDFISFMRSGGELGADHQYSTNRLSASGGANLYQYLLSLAQGAS